MNEKEMAYWRDRYAEEGLEYHSKQGGHAGGTPKFWDQFGFRFRKDDGREDLQETDGGATWAAGLNVDIEWPINKPLRLRYLYARTARDASPHEHALFISHELGPYQRVERDTNTVRFFGSYWIDHDITSTDFTGRIGTGVWSLTDNVAPSHVLKDSGSTDFPEWRIGTVPDVAFGDCESELCIIMDPADVSIGDTIDLKQVISGAADYRSYVNTPRITAVAEEAALPTKELLISP